MNKFEALGLPKNFKDLLPKLKKQTIQWETMCYSGTEINNYATISFYASLDAPHSNIILCPGLATNTDIDPLSKMITYWALTHKFNVITLNTFLGRFDNNPSLGQAQRNTYPEFITLLQNCITYIQKYSIGKNIIIGHSAGATGIIDAMNEMTAQGIKSDIDSVMLFAPWVSIKWFKSMQKNAITRHPQYNGFIPIVNVLNTEKYEDGAHYLPITSEFFTDMAHRSFRPDLMNQWNTYITIIAGEKDKKTFTSLLSKRYEQLAKQTNSDKFSFLLLPNAKHSFVDIYKNSQIVIDLIKSQREKLQHHKTRQKIPSGR